MIFRLLDSQLALDGRCSPRPVYLVSSCLSPALTYSLTRDIVKFQLRSSPVDDPSNEAIGAAVAGTIQGLTRFPRGPAIGCGVALGGITYLAMKYGMDSIKKLPFEKL